MLQVGIQELHSKLDTSTCANCFTAVGETRLKSVATFTVAAELQPFAMTGCPAVVTHDIPCN